MGGGRHLAHLLDDDHLRLSHAPVALGLGTQEKLLPRHGAPHGEMLDQSPSSDWWRCGSYTNQKQKKMIPVRDQPYGRVGSLFRLLYPEYYYFIFYHPTICETGQGYGQEGYFLGHHLPWLGITRVSDPPVPSHSLEISCTWYTFFRR